MTQISCFETGENYGVFSVLQYFSQEFRNVHNDILPKFHQMENVPNPSQVYVQRNRKFGNNGDLFRKRQ